MSQPETLSLAERQRLVSLTRELGFREACKRVNMKPEAMARLIGGLEVKRPTLVLASSAIATLPPATVSAPVPDPTAVSVRPVWLDAWAEKYLAADQRVAFEKALAKNAPNWVKR